MAGRAQQCLSSHHTPHSLHHSTNPPYPRQIRSPVAVKCQLPSLGVNQMGAHCTAPMRNPRPLSPRGGAPGSFGYRYTVMVCLVAVAAFTTIVFTAPNAETLLVAEILHGIVSEIGIVVIKSKMSGLTECKLLSLLLFILFLLFFFTYPNLLLVSHPLLNPPTLFHFPHALYFDAQPWQSVRPPMDVARAALHRHLLRPRIAVVARSKGLRRGCQALFAEADEFGEGNGFRCGRDGGHDGPSYHDS